MPASPTVLERILDGPERVLLRLPWPSSARIILKGSFGFLRQILRSRTLAKACPLLEGRIGWHRES